MILAAQALQILFATTILSGLFVLIYRGQQAFNVDHRQRLAVLKISMVLAWVVPAVSWLIIYSRAGVVIEVLLPVSDILGMAKRGSGSGTILSEWRHSYLSQAGVALYLIGLLVVLFRFARNYLAMRKLLLWSSAQEINGCAVRSSGLVTSPFSFGFLNPQIFVPSSFLRDHSQRAVEVVLAHEATHLKHRDPQWKLFSLVTRAFLFFAPTAYYLHQKLELEMEIRCDEATMEATKVSVVEYGNVLIDAMGFGHGNTNPMFAYLSDSNLKRRIQAMKTKTSRRPVLSFLLAALVLAASATAVAAVSGVSKYIGRYLVLAEVSVDGELISSPQLVVLQNEVALIEIGEKDSDSLLRMEVIASEYTDEHVSGAIQLKMDVKYSRGKQVVHATPRVVTAPGEPAWIQIETDAGLMEMKINLDHYQ